MEIKRLVSKYVYRIEPKPGGGFIARANDPGVPALEASTREELQQKVQSTILAGLGTDFPGLKLPMNSGELKFAFHVEKQPDGTFDIHSSDPSAGPLNAASHDQVENHFAEKLISFVGQHMLKDAPEVFRNQLASGDIKVFINKSSGFTITTKHDGNTSEFGSLSQLFGQSQASAHPMLTGNSGSIASPTGNFGASGTPIDSSPITPVTKGGGKFLRILLALTILATLIYFFLHHR